MSDQWIVGWNNSGCLPDNEPYMADTWEEAIELLCAEIEEDVEREAENGNPTGEALLKRIALDLKQGVYGTRTPISIYGPRVVYWIG